MFTRVFLIVFFSLPLFICAEEPIRVHASEFEIDGHSEKVYVHGDVKVEKDDALITSKRADYTHSKQLISFKDDVSLVKGPIQVKSQTLEAYNLTDQIKAKGDVSFVYQDLEGQADRAIYSINKEILVLSGHSKARQGKDKISGEKIVIDVKHKRIVTQGRAKIKISGDESVEVEAK